MADLITPMPSQLSRPRKPPKAYGFLCFYFPTSVEVLSQSRLCPCCCAHKTRPVTGKPRLRTTHWIYFLRKRSNVLEMAQQVSGKRRTSTRKCDLQSGLSPLHHWGGKELQMSPPPLTCFFTNTDKFQQKPQLFTAAYCEYPLRFIQLPLSQRTQNFNAPPHLSS